jgi:hypothetical protein
MDISPDLNNPDRWIVLKNLDYWESNLSQDDNMHRVCENDNRYVAFNSMGYGKHTVDLNRLYSWTGINLYVKKRRFFYLELVVGDKRAALDFMSGIVDVFIDYFGEFKEHPRTVRGMEIGDNDFVLNSLTGTEYDCGLFKFYSNQDLSLVIPPRIELMRKRKTIAFLITEYTERGTSIATYDYADLNETVLGNTSVILELESTVVSDPVVMNRFRKRFGCARVVEFTEESFLEFDAVYVITYGGRLEAPLTNPDWRTRFIVHCVFETRFSQLNGLNTRTVAISSEMNKRLGTRLFVLPHVVRVHPTNDDLRSELGIPANAIVFGFYGGRDSFNIEFAQEAVIRVSERSIREGRSIYFVFMNSDEFGSNERIMYVPKSLDPEYKRKFINTCDAMLHARWRGETFGLACAEFGLCGKPILTYENSIERHHIDVMGGLAILYKELDDLVELLWNYSPEGNVCRGRGVVLAYSAFSPERVMSAFNGLLL